MEERSENRGNTIIFQKFNHKKFKKMIYISIGDK